MPRDLFSGDYPKACRYCYLGKKSNSGNKILCEKKGIVDADFSCRRYKYDPLKRVPRKMPELPKYNSDEFKL